MADNPRMHSLYQAGATCQCRLSTIVGCLSAERKALAGGGAESVGNFGYLRYVFRVDLTALVNEDVSDGCGVPEPRIVQDGRDPFALVFEGELVGVLNAA